MNLTYFRFLGRNLSKKWYIWLLLLLSLLITALFLLLVPSLLHTAPWDFWGNTNLLPQSMLMFVGALFSSVLAIAIFKEYADDGTELIIVSKPINRTKIIVTKFLIFVFFSLGFALSSIFIALGTFAFQQGKDHPDLVGALVLSVFVSNLVFTLLFGFFAIIISLFLNKVWTILLNVIVVTLLTIYSTVTMVAVQTPAEIAGKHSSYVNSIKYLTTDHTIQMGAALSPVDVDHMDNPLAFNDIPGQSEFWHKYMNESTADTATTFNVVGQFTQMNNLLGLGKYQKESSNAFFDSSRMFSYDFDNVLSIETPGYTPISIPEINKQIDEVKWGTDPHLKDILPQAIKHLMQLETDQAATVLGTSHNSTESEFTQMLDLNQYDFRIGFTNKNWSGSKGQDYSADQIDSMTTDKDKEMFDKILAFFEDSTVAEYFLKPMEDEEWGLYNRTHAGFAEKFNIEHDGWDDIKGVEESKSLSTDDKSEELIKEDLQLLVNGTERTAVRNVYDFLHLILVDNKSSLYPEATTPADQQIALMETMLKLKYYLFTTISQRFQGDAKNGIPPIDDLQCAANTPLDIEAGVDGQHLKLRTKSSPILPLGHRDIGTDPTKYPISYLQDPADIEKIEYVDGEPSKGPKEITLKLDKVMWNSKELIDLINERIDLDDGVQNTAPFDSDPDLDALLTINTLTNIACNDKNTPDIPYHVDGKYSPWGGSGFDITVKEQTTTPWASAFYGYTDDGWKIMTDRAFAWIATKWANNGYENGNDQWNFERNRRFIANLNTDSSMNYPLLYQNLMSPFTVKPLMNNGMIILGWLCCTIILGSIAATIFVRKDFK